MNSRTINPVAHFSPEHLQRSTAQAQPRQPRPLPKPSWYPEGLKAPREKLKALLQNQGLTEERLARGDIKYLSVHDIDLTLVETVTFMYLRLKPGRSGPPYMLDPREQGRLLVFGGGPTRKEFQDYLEFQKRFPGLPYQDYRADNIEQHSMLRLLNAPTISPGMARLRAASQAPDTLVLINTAREAPTTFAAISEKVRLERAGIDALLGVNDPAHLEALGLSGRQVTTGQAKAIGIKQVIELLQEYGNPLETVSFDDDDDHNQVACMQLLPAVFPKLQFDFVSLVHVSSDSFSAVPAAHGIAGELISPCGKAVPPEGVATYHTHHHPYEIVEPW